MSNKEVVIILVDQNLNLVTTQYGNNSSFIKTRINMQDYPADNNIDMAAQNAAIRFLKESFAIYASKARLFDTQIINETAEKVYVFIYKLDSNEKITIQNNQTISFVSINRLPLSFTPLSASIAVVLTNNFDLFKRSPNPPGIITINYPVQVPIYMPIITVPFYRSVFFNKENATKKFKKIIELTDNFSSEKVKNSPVVPRSEIKKASHEEMLPKRISSESSKYKKSSKRSSKKSKKSSKSSKSSRSSRSSRSSKSSRSSSSSSDEETSERKRRKRKSKREKGGYYDKYLKYKMKYLELQKKFIELELN